MGRVDKPWLIRGRDLERGLWVCVPASGGAVVYCAVLWCAVGGEGISRVEARRCRVAPPFPPQWACS